MRNPRLILVCLLASFTSALGFPVRAQITPDQTLGAESSTISNTDINDLPADLIEGGATRGTNLFHSFSEFNVSAAQQVYFDSPAGIDSILSRVTGNSFSSINGRLGTTGESSAALILMNPNGIVFGENASLDVQGAFTATTATGIQLGEEGSFNAIDLEDDNLLSISPSAFFFSALTTTQPDIRIESSRGLQVPSGEILSLLAEDVSLDSSTISSPGSRVEIVAVKDTGIVGVNEKNEISLDDDIIRGDILIENGSAIDVRSAEGGEVKLTANNIQIQSGSLLLAGVSADVSSAEGKSGSVELNATGRVQVSGADTIIQSSLGSGSVGQAEGIVIRADEIRIEEGALIDATTLGTGGAGNIVLDAGSNISIDSALVFTLVASDAVGQGGNVSLSARDIDILSASNITALTLGEGDAGNVDITATGAVEVLGNSAGRPIISSAVGGDSEGQGGDISISATSFDAGGDVLIAANTFGVGGVGNIRIDVSGDARFGVVGSPTLGSIINVSGARSVEKGGDIEIEATNIEVLNGFQVGTATFGRGDAGNLKISASDRLRIDGVNQNIEIPTSSGVRSLVVDSTGQAGSVEIIAGNLEVTGGGVIGSSTAGEGNAGVVVIDILETARFDGFNPTTFAPSGVRSNGSAVGDGEGGEIRLSAANLYITNGAQLIAASTGKGDAGNIHVDVSETVYLDGAVFDGRDVAPSAIGSDVFQGGAGNAGNIKVTATDLEIVNGALISSDVLGQGNAGSITIAVSETVSVDGASPVTGRSPSTIGSGIQPGAKGQGGDIEVAAADIEVTNGGQISTSTFGEGDAGRIELNASETIRVDGVNPVIESVSSSIGSGVQTDAKGQGGSVEIAAANLEVTNGGQIEMSVLGEGSAGNLLIDVSETVLVSGRSPVDEQIPSSLGSSVALEGIGQGGNIEIASKNLYVVNEAQIAAASSGQGDAGRIALRVDEQVRVDDDGDIVTLSSFDSGGEIIIQSGGILLRDNGDISTLVRNGTGVGGNITIEAAYAVALDDSDIVAFSSGGRGGDIDLTRTTLFSQSLNVPTDNLSEDNLFALDGNERVDINATGGVESGEISINDASFIENDLSELTDDLIDGDTLIANTCFAGSEEANGTFVTRGSDRTPQSPTNPLTTSYPLGTVQPAPAEQSAAIQEPQGLYQLADGRLVMSHHCE